MFILTFVTLSAQASTAISSCKVVGQSHSKGFCPGIQSPLKIIYNYIYNRKTEDLTLMLRVRMVTLPCTLLFYLDITLPWSCY